VRTSGHVASRLGKCDYVIHRVFGIHGKTADLSYMLRERTDLTTDTESVPIYVDGIRVRSNERSVTNLAVICCIKAVSFASSNAPQNTATGGTKQRSHYAVGYYVTCPCRQKLNSMSFQHLPSPLTKPQCTCVAG